MMLKGTFFENPAYCQYARLLAQLHDLIAVSGDEGPDGDDLRAKLDVCGEGLTDDEIISLQGLAGDFYSLQEAAPALNGVRPIKELSDALNAEQSGDFVTALALVRKSRSQIEPSQLSYFRGRFLHDAGLTDLAIRFFKHASTLDPNNAYYEYANLDALKKLNVVRARSHADEILRFPDSHHPILRLLAAQICFDSRKDLPPSAAGALQRKLIPVLEVIIVAFESGGDVGVRESLLPMAYYLCGECFKADNDVANALRCFDRAVFLRPADDAMLVARGILLYGRDSVRAAADFDKAIAFGANIVWPYFFLAHYYLVTGRYVDCLSASDTALRFPSTDKVRANCFEWRAICQAMLEYDDDIVRESFEQAIRLAPANRRIAKNRDAFEAHAADPSLGPISWEENREGDVRELVSATS